MMRRNGDVDRRKFIAGLASGAAASIAGCSGANEQETTTDSPTETTAESTTQGGNIIFGAATGPSSLNPLTASDAYAWAVLDNIYDQGIVFHPETQEVAPWAFTDWTLQDEDSGSPTVVAQLRDDLSWTDGEDLTAEDVKFTVEYVQDQQPAGSISASQYRFVESVEASGDYEVTYHFSQPDSGWLAEVLGNYILPQHRWQNVDDYSNYTPRNEGGPVGSGAFVLGDYNWDNWIQLDVRENVGEQYPIPQDADFIHDEAPFVDSFRYEVFGSQQAMVESLLNGDIHVPYGTVPVQRAVEARENDGTRVVQSGDNGWNHISFNTRRVPLDDKAFRQLLVRLWPSRYHVEDVMQNIGAIDGDLAAPASYEDYRPYPPDHENVEQFPFFESDDAVVDVEAARDFLLNHSEAKHDYSIESAASNTTSAPDGNEIFVNGQPLTEVHTDNNGNSGQGPLVFTLQPPEDHPLSVQSHNRWTEIVQTVGIPLEQSVESFNAMLPKVYQNENFDMYQMGWTGTSPQITYLPQYFGEAGADLDGSSDAQRFNAMGYTGAQDLIDEQQQLMNPEDRRPVVGDALMQIYEDCPTNVFQYEQMLQPVSTDWTGFVQAPGGVRNRFSWLNVRQA